MHTVNAWKFDSCEARFVDESSTEEDENCYFEVFNGEIWLIASRDIEPYEELFTKYGHEYWCDSRWPLSYLLAMYAKYAPTLLDNAEARKAWSVVISARQNLDAVQRAHIPKSILKVQLRTTQRAEAAATRTQPESRTLVQAMSRAQLQHQAKLRQKKRNAAKRERQQEHHRRDREREAYDKTPPHQNADALIIPWHSVRHASTTSKQTNQSPQHQPLLTGTRRHRLQCQHQTGQKACSSTSIRQVQNLIVSRNDHPSDLAIGRSTQSRQPLPLVGSLDGTATYPASTSRLPPLLASPPEPPPSLEDIPFLPTDWTHEVLPSPDGGTKLKVMTWNC